MQCNKDDERVLKQLRVPRLTSTLFRFVAFKSWATMNAVIEQMTRDPISRLDFSLSKLHDRLLPKGFRAIE